MIRIYLAGPIRDGAAEDIEWREQIVDLVGRNRAIFLNPLAANRYWPRLGLWTISGRLSTPSLILGHDLWSIRQADVILAHLGQLGQYPCVGTLMELGMGLVLDKMIYTIGCTIPHPFFSRVAHNFKTVADAGAFLARQVQALDGTAPLTGD